MSAPDCQNRRVEPADARPSGLAAARGGAAPSQRTRGGRPCWALSAAAEQSPPPSAPPAAWAGGRPGPPLLRWTGSSAPCPTAARAGRKRAARRTGCGGERRAGWRPAHGGAGCSGAVAPPPTVGSRIPALVADGRAPRAGAAARPCPCPGRGACATLPPLPFFHRMAARRFPILRMTLTEAHDSASIWRTISSSLEAFYRFSRPRTVTETAVVAALLMNIYIVGLNKLFDIEID
ncbi:skin secretory protein xP2-like [Panicum virgatum]|uniref:skin secretory protein xP2-like n=1 Tax=Panicum virgatum TaxID=38727 RepID=UPI0019D630BF|nr:skin secretory protein xP2-like [Panicum virgatum]